MRLLTQTAQVTFRFEISMAAKVDDLASAEAVVVVNQLGDYVC